MDIESLVANGSIIKTLPNQFFKSLSKMEISIKHKKVNIDTKTDKVLIGNSYQHININDVNTNIVDRLTTNFINKVRKLLGKYS